MRRLLRPEPPSAVALRLTRAAVLAYWAALATMTHLPQLRGVQEVVTWKPDKEIHAALFALLTLGVMVARPLGAARPWRTHVLFGAAVVALYAPLDEWTQGFVGRTVSAADLLANYVGIALALVAGLLARPTVPDPDAAAPAPPAATRGFVRHAVTVGLFTFISRLSGLVRDSILAAALGLTGIADAFFLGFLLPNLFRRLFGEGALTAAFIPHYTDLRRLDPPLARRFASLCILLLAAVLGVLTVAGELILWALLPLQWSAQTALALRLMMVMLPYMPAICLVALIGGVLQVHGRFAAPAAAPVLLNLVMIAAAAAGMFVFGDGRLGMAKIALAVAVGVLVAGFVQLGWQLLALWRVEPITLQFTGTGPAARATLAMLLPMLVGLAVFQINSFTDSLIAYSLAQRLGGPEAFTLLGRTLAYPMNEGAVAALQWAQRLYQFPLGVFGLAVATAIFPALASAPGAEAFRATLRHGLRLTMFIGLPASVGLILVRTPLARVIYERGEFTTDDAARVGAVLAGYSASVWAYSMTHVLTRAFYARKDAKTPLRISMAMVGFNLTLNLVLIWPLGAAGLAWATALSAVGQVALLIRGVRRHVEAPVDAGVWRAWGRTAALTAVMAAALLPITWWFPPLTLTVKGAALQLAAMVTIGGGVFAGAALLLRADEVRWLLRRRRG